MIEKYNYNDVPSGRTDTLIQAIEKIERLEKQLKIAVEALENIRAGNKMVFDKETGMPYFTEELALQQIKELEK